MFHTFRIADHQEVGDEGATVNIKLAIAVHAEGGDRVAAQFAQHLQGRKIAAVWKWGRGTEPFPLRTLEFLYCRHAGRPNARPALAHRAAPPQACFRIDSSDATPSLDPFRQA